jgi:hypothetical protein
VESKAGFMLQNELRKGKFPANFSGHIILWGYTLYFKSSNYL